MNNIVNTSSLSQVYPLQIDQQQYSSDDPIVTGQQLLDLADKRPSDQFLVYQVLTNGQMEGIRPDETVDLTRSGVERFLTYLSDRAFFFTLDGRKIEWPAATITGRKLKDLAKVDPATYEVWQEVRGADDRAIEDRELVSLEAPGTERFFTGKKTTTEG
jgi:Multiubiquitin